MGIALMPRAMLDAFPERAALSVHALPARFSRSQTVPVRRKDNASSKIDALVESLKNTPAR
jgi:DNA-binding transcriptional LysR family regulator